MKNRILLFLLIAFVSGTACKDDDDGGNGAPPSGYDLIINKNFRIVDQEVKANGSIIADGRDLLNCELDNLDRYESSGTASTRFGILKCNANEPNEQFYFWSLISEDTKLILDHGGPSLSVYNILVNNGSRLVLERYTIEDINNDGSPESIQTTTFYTRD
ncbi:MAG: hypothetical protein JKY48_19285 [Flavobacteriales bacterium]|nr:hypothetical protein [Flavobacteriales bacterium]